MATPLPENSAIFTVDEVARATSAELIVRGSGKSFEGVTTDTRGSCTNKLFVALRGERFDGHKFISKAVSEGARGVLVDELRELEIPPGVAVLRVPDTEQALLDLGGAERAKFSGRVVAVAGSAGKTTTRSLISSVLEGLRPGRIHSTRGNLNNRIGVALSLLALPLDSEVMVLELGTNAPGEVTNLARAVRPHLGVLTLIALEHTEGLIDLDGVEAEEAALFDFLRSSGGVALGNVDDLRVRKQLGRFSREQRLSYGFSSDADVRIVHSTVEPDLSSRFALALPSGELAGTTALLSPVRALAAAAAAAVAEFLFPGEIRAPALLRALDAPAEPGRGRMVRDAAGALWIDESYNSNPSSARACIDAARELARVLGAELTLVLGEMRELGAHSQSEHETLGEYVAELAPARVLFVGGDAERAMESARARGVRAEFFRASELARASLPSFGFGDIVLLKGSRGVGLEALLPSAGRDIPSEPDSARGSALGTLAFPEN